MGSSISRWGNSLALRLPKALLETADIHEGDEVTITAHGGGLLVRRAPRVNVEAMIAAITPENAPDESHDYAPVGREIL